MRSADHPFDGVDCRAGGEQRHLVRLGRGIGVGIERGGAPARRGDPIEVSFVVNAGQLLSRRFARRDDFAAALAPGAGDHLHHFGALGPLGMSGRRRVLHEAPGMNHNQRHAHRF
jgi:hypothetical protein